MDTTLISFFCRILQKKTDWRWILFNHNHYKSTLFPRQIGEVVHATTIETVHDGIMVTLRFCYFAKHGEIKFDAEKHFYWYEIRITDLLFQTGRKTLLHYVVSKEKEEVALTKEVFDQLKNVANFIDTFKKEDNTADLRQAMEILQL